MLFNSFEFFLFLLVIVFTYYFMIQKRWVLGSKALLLVASLFFYAFWNINYLPLLLFSIVINWLFGNILIASKNTWKKCFLFLGISINVILLTVFKYTDFFIENVNSIFHTHLPLQHILLPLAISFFTFQQIAYLVDSYKGNIVRKYALPTYALFVSFFPQLIAGPIVAHYEMLPQFERKKSLLANYQNLFQGVLIFLIGLFKKIVLADALAQYASLGFDEISSLTLIGGWFTALSYTLQIYFDFSGYCDMALGCAKLFNITLPINFNSPYKATNIQDFWRRWHITLSRFLRDYLYIPLGGNKKGELRTYSNIILVFLIGGLWHGAAWTFVFWGLLHGLANVVFRLWKKTGLHLNKFLSWFIMFNFINVSWIFFRAKSFSSALKVLKSMVDISSLKNLPAFRAKYYLEGFDAHSSVLYGIIILIVACLILPNSNELIQKCKINSKTASLLWGISLAGVFALLMLKMLVIPYSEFIYFNF